MFNELWEMGTGGGRWVWKGVAEEKSGIRRMERQNSWGSVYGELYTELQRNTLKTNNSSKNVRPIRSESARLIDASKIRIC